MKIKEYTDGPLVCWRWSSGWDAVYASKEPGPPVKTHHITGWALVGVIEPGRKNPTPEIHGVFSVIDNEFTLAGWEKSFLGYCRQDEDAEKLYGKAARTLLKSIAAKSKGVRGARKP